MTIQRLMSVAAVLVLVGGGCAGAQDYSSSSTEQAAKETSAAMDSMEQVDTDIVITKAEPQGDRTLLVEFKTSKKAANTAEGYRLILSSDKTPTWPTKGYWYQLGPSHTEKEWKGLPLGERQLRACIVENDVCGAYSDIITVEVQ